jgi:hypothetical protein
MSIPPSPIVPQKILPLRAKRGESDATLAHRMGDPGRKIPRARRSEMKPRHDRREASWTAAALCRFSTARPKAPEGWRTPKAVATSPRLVERILSAKQRDASADVSALEREIDELEYALYGLTPEEKALVQAAAK